MMLDLGVTLTRIKKRDYANEVGLIICQDFYNDHMIEPLEKLGEQLLNKFGLNFNTCEPSYADCDFFEDKQVAQVFCSIQHTLTHPDKIIDNEFDDDEFTVYDAWEMWFDKKLYVDVVEPISKCDFAIFENIDWGEISFSIVWDILQVRQDYNQKLGVPWFYHHTSGVSFGADIYC